MIGLPLRVDPQFAGEAVFFALRQRVEAARYQDERERFYKIADPEEREREFQRLDLRWFEGLGLASPIEQSIREQPLVTRSVRAYIVARARGKRDEGAELFVSAEIEPDEQAQRTLAVVLRPESLLHPEPLLTLLRHELFHIADMIDPYFGYTRELPAAEGGPTHDRLLIERYRVLWDATIDGRMARRGWTPQAERAEHRVAFGRAFPMFGAETEKTFARFFDSEPHTHAALAAFARTPMGAAGCEGAGAHPGSRCPLCGFPTHVFVALPGSLPSEVVARIGTDFPDWTPGLGLCVQCADLYHAHDLSAAAAHGLAGFTTRTFRASLEREGS